MFGRAIDRKGETASPGQKREVYLAQSLMILGIIIGVIGVWLAVNKH